MTTKKTGNYEGKIEALTKVTKESMQKLAYHNFAHALDVYTAANTYAVLTNVNYEDRFVLRTATLLHDIIVVPGARDNEERSAEFARNYLPGMRYTNKQIKKVEKLILATKLPQRPNNYLEKIICDADVDNLGREDFFEKGEQIREELGLPKNIEWYKLQLRFLKEHKYHTKIAKELRNTGKLVNIRKLEKMLEK